MSGVLIAGRRALLREMTEVDAETVVAWRNRPDVARWLIQAEPLTVEGHLRWFARARGAGDVVLIFVLHDGTPIGAGSLYDFDRPRRVAEWGRLCTAAQAEYGPAILEAGYLVHRLGFEYLGVERTYCGCSSENDSALRLNRYLGYVDEGVRRRHLWSPEGYRDVIEFGMLADDFNRRRPDLERVFYRRDSLPHFTDEVGALARRLGVSSPAGPA